MADADARRWAAKEAAFKSLSSHARILPGDVGYTRSAAGPPSMAFERDVQLQSGELAQRAARLLVSVSHDGDYVAAYVLAESLYKNA